MSFYFVFGVQKRVWKMLQRSEKPINEEVQFRNVKDKMWTTHFRKLIHTEELENYYHPINEQTNQLEIDAEEIVETILTSKNEKASGNDDILYELIKYHGSKVR